MITKKKPALTLPDDIRDLIEATREQIRFFKSCVENNKSKEACEKELPVLKCRLEMLEKQLPMQVLDVQYETDEYFDYVGKCPRCQNNVIQEYNYIYCGDCGQALKWE